MFTTIQSKLATAFGLLTVLLLILAGFSHQSISAVHDQFDSLVQGNTVRAQLSNNVLDGVHGRAIEARNLLVASEPPQRQRALQALKQHSDQLDASISALQQAGKTGVSDKEQSLIEEIAAIEQRYHVVASNILGKFQRGDIPAAIQQMNAECIPMLNQLVTAVHAHLSYLEEDAA